MINHEQKEHDPLALGLTRAPLFMGVNLRVFFGNVVLCALISINAQSWWGIPLFIFIHLLAVRLSIKEPDYFNLKFNSFIKTPPVRNFWYVGFNTYEPW
ncbi:MAG: hypothetical protein A3F13_06970 [Gammaproteobacteria bacterium RIFCSPHIGHO2_12_FULL_40_19]|nr:MAG: hypothetical protein A3F13_06970 [Gammaproteobacteria bacterium RIFCSPHIGHO2_12_FULL_40_19]